MGFTRFPNRWIHMDFHTSPLIPGIAAEFNSEEFANTLKEAYVDSVTVFALCHHGQCYYPTQIGKKHPHLHRDLLGDMISACHAEGINVPAYISVVWNEQAAKEHPEWCQIETNGKFAGRSPLDNSSSSWRWICMNNPEFVNYISKLTKEVIEGYNVDGIFFDIVKQCDPGCVCQYCLDSMEEKNLDPTNEDDLRKHSLIVSQTFMKKMSNLIWSEGPDLTVFYNSNLRLNPEIEKGNRPELNYHSHLEIESLPSGDWGYNHFPLFIRYFRNMGKSVIGMTGRFHKSWGDFGGLKNQAALEFECFQSLAHGAACSIGDQLHPTGKLNETVYSRIKEVYQLVAEKESWCINADPVTEIGLMLVNSSKRNTDNNGMANEEGAMQMLQESHYQFDLIDEESDFMRYRLIILPDQLNLTDKVLNKLKRFIKSGGKLIASDEALLDKDDNVFSIPLGVKYKQNYPYTPHYISPDSKVFSNVSQMDYVMYETGTQIEAESETEILAKLGDPYFNRTYKTFSSHAQAPLSTITNYPAMTKRNNIVYISSPVFKAYRFHGNKIYKEMVQKALELLIPEPVIKAKAPTTATITVMKQENRMVVHLLHYIPQRKARDIDIIEDKIPLYRIPIKLRAEHKPRYVSLVPKNTDLDFKYNGGYVEFEVPEIYGHQMVSVEL